jgi:hypothetical protein
VKGWRTTKSALHDHSLSISKPAMARRAEDVITFPAAFQTLAGYREGKSVDQLSIAASRVKMLILPQAPAGHRASDIGSGGTSVIEEITRFQRFEAGLVVHVLSASHRQK